MQRHRWAIDVIWFLTVHLCPVGPRVLDNMFFEYSHYPHVGPWIPLTLVWVIFNSLEPQSSLGLYYYPVLMPCFTALFTIAHGAPVLFRNKCETFSRYREAQSHFWVPSRLQPLAQTSGSISKPANFVAGSLVGCPPEIKYESCECSVVMPRACVAICAPLQGKSF